MLHILLFLTHYRTLPIEHEQIMSENRHVPSTQVKRKKIRKVPLTITYLPFVKTCKRVQAQRSSLIQIAYKLNSINIWTDWMRIAPKTEDRTGSIGRPKTRQHVISGHGACVTISQWTQGVTCIELKKYPWSELILLYDAHTISLTIYLDTGLGKHRKLNNLSDLAASLGESYCETLSQVLCVHGRGLYQRLERKRKSCASEKAREEPQVS